MLKADMVVAQTGEVVTQDIEEKTMEQLLEFIYTGEIDNMGDQLEMLLYAAWDPATWVKNLPEC